MIARTGTPDLLVVNPGSKRQLYQDLSTSLSAIEPPIWAGMIARYARIKGYGVEVLDANAEGLGSDDVAERVAEIDPVLVAVVVYGQNPSASTMVMPAAGRICSAIKEREPERNVLLVGGHVAAVPERTLREEDADYACDGEGPVTVTELIDCLKATGGDLAGVRGLLYRDRDRIVRNERAPLVGDLDTEMPGLAWDLLPMQNYRSHNWQCFGRLEERTPYGSLYTTLGCPYHCDFCCIQAPFRSGERAAGLPETVSTYRCWSPESVLAQLDTLVNDYGVKTVKFADELFVLKEKHVVGICDGIIERGYDLNIWAYARCDRWTPKMLERMKQAGVDWVCLGIESGSERVRDDMSKGYGQDVLYETIQAFRDAGIYIIANFIFGLPEDDRESMQETLDLALELNCEFANFYSAMAYPGSQLFNRAVELELPLPEHWSGYSQHATDTLPLPTNYLSGVEVLRFRDEAFHTYFSNPAYLAMVREKFGQETVDHITDMASRKLERVHLA